MFYNYAWYREALLEYYSVSALVSSRFLRSPGYAFPGLKDISRLSHVNNRRLRVAASESLSVEDPVLFRRATL